MVTSAAKLYAKFQKLATIIGRPRYLRAMRFGVAAGVEHAQVLNGITCSTVVDIGANRGQFALVARHCFPDANIISFEPLSLPASLFRKVFGNDKRVTLHEAAVGVSHGEATIHISQRDDSSSLLAITAMQNAIFPGTAEATTAVIQVGRLDEYVADEDLRAPALLKLDVQGYELQALVGCEDLLNQFSYVYAECSFVELYEGQALADTIIAWLKERGLHLAGIYHMNYDRSGRSIQADFLFARREKDLLSDKSR
ncbi:FkbM family methyltransferase [Nevskia soli]|uniref:FkbM family methyltransferase n=1 Tax=Nevskia soli TaxID=418856 RepID=UPI0004A765B0|nr:FkbM family methyltransferase [Nevskia soli]